MENEISELIADVREQVMYLRELGVDAVDVKLPETMTPIVIAPVTSAPELVVPTAVPPKIEIPTPQTKPRTGSRLASLPSLAKRPPAELKDGAVRAAEGQSTVESSAGANVAAEGLSSKSETMFGDIGGLPESSETMEKIWADIGNCTRCPLHEGRTQIVQTVGNYQSDLMFIGEAPGADEDAKGEPFVGRAGQLLNKIIEAIGMKREEVCIGNINRCRPPGNRQPTLPEAHTCKPFLLREIAVIRPKVIVVMGNTALHNLLDTKVGITRMRGQFHDYFGVKVMPTFHPAYLLRDPSKKREVWDDMKKVRDYLVSVGGI